MSAAKKLRQPAAANDPAPDESAYRKLCAAREEYLDALAEKGKAFDALNAARGAFDDARRKADDAAKRLDAMRAAFDVAFQARVD